MEKSDNFNVFVFPHTSFENNCEINPTHFDIFTPTGNGVYGYQNNQVLNPLMIAPPQEPSGGIIFFDSSIDNMKEKLLSLFSLLEIENTRKYYALFKESLNPRKDGYIQQMRIVSDFAMKHLFKFENKEPIPEQPFNIPMALHYFAYAETIRLGTGYSEKLKGMFGGDGYFGKEKLSFGFMIENQYHGVYRIWSRAWLVTK